MAPFYILLLPLLLRSPYHEQLVKKYWWRAGAFFVFALAAGLLIISPARPLFPTRIISKIQSRHANSKLLARVEDVYSIYQNRNHAFAPVLAVLPADLKVLGLISYDDPETSLWQPFGSRRIVCVTPDDTSDYLNSRGVHLVLAKMSMFGTQFPDYAVWMKKMNATIIDQAELDIRAGTGPAVWYLFEIHGPPGPPTPGSVSTLQRVRSASIQPNR